MASNNIIASDRSSSTQFHKILLNLLNQLSSRRQNQTLRNQRGLTLLSLTPLFNQLMNNRNRVGSGFSGSCLGTGHDVFSVDDIGDGILLDGGGFGPFAFFDVFEDFGVDFGFGEGFDFGDLAVAGDFAGDVEVVVEFDAWMGGEKKNLVRKIILKSQNL